MTVLYCQDNLVAHMLMQQVMSTLRPRLLTPSPRVVVQLCLHCTLHSLLSQQQCNEQSVHCLHFALLAVQLCQCVPAETAP